MFLLGSTTMNYSIPVPLSRMVDVTIFFLAGIKNTRRKIHDVINPLIKIAFLAF